MIPDVLANTYFIVAVTINIHGMSNVRYKQILCRTALVQAFVLYSIWNLIHLAEEWDTHQAKESLGRWRTDVAEDLGYVQVLQYAGTGLQTWMCG